MPAPQSRHDPVVKTDELSRLLDLAYTRANQYIEATPGSKVVPSQQQLSALDSLNEDLNPNPTLANEVLQQLATLGDSTTNRTTGGRYFGFVNGGILPIALATNWLVDTWDQNAALHVMSPLGTSIETTCECWLVDLLGLPESTVASFVTGSSVGNICGIAAARNHILQKHDWDVQRQGLQGAPNIRLVASASAHSSIAKAIAILGLGTDNVIVAPVDEQGRVDPDQLPELDENTILILQAGNVNSGSFDPFKTLCKIANDAGSWVHIDGAFGLWAAASKQYDNLTQGIELADSWVTDAHKTLNAGYDGGIVFCKHPQDLTIAMAASASYIQYSEQRDPMTLAPEMSRRARAIQIWAILKTLGKEGVNQLVNQLCERASLFAELLRDAGFIIDNDVVFNQVLFRLDSDEETLVLLTQIQNSGELWCGGANWRGNQVIRVSVCSWLTTTTDIEESVAWIINASSTLEN